MRKIFLSIIVSLLVLPMMIISMYALDFTGSVVGVYSLDRTDVILDVEYFDVHIEVDGTTLGTDMTNWYNAFDTIYAIPHVYYFTDPAEFVYDGSIQFDDIAIMHVDYDPLGASSSTIYFYDSDDLLIDTINMNLLDNLMLIRVVKAVDYTTAVVGDGDVEFHDYIDGIRYYTTYLYVDDVLLSQSDISTWYTAFDNIYATPHVYYLTTPIDFYQSGSIEVNDVSIIFVDYDPLGSDETYLYLYDNLGNPLFSETFFNLDNTYEFENFENTSFIVNYNTNGGSLIESETYNADENVIKPSDPTKDNALFVGWYLNSSLTTEFKFYDFEFTAEKLVEYGFSLDEDVEFTLYAKWRSLSVDCNYPLINDITNSTFDVDFTGWSTTFTSSADVSRVANSVQFTVTDNNISRYAQLKLTEFDLIVGHEYYIQFDVTTINVNFSILGFNEGSPIYINNTGIVSLIDTASSTEFILKTVIDGYDDNVVIDNIVLIDLTDLYGSGDEPSQTGTIYAWYEVWNTVYTVDFDTVGGNVILPVEYGVCDIVSKPTDPIKEGYIFVGWYSDLEYTNSWNFNVDKMPPYNIHLYAKYTVAIDTQIDDFLDDGGLGGTFGRVMITVVVILLISIVLALFKAPKMLILIIDVALLILAITLGFIPIWLTVLLTIIAFALFYLSIKGGTSNE